MTYETPYETKADPLDAAFAAVEPNPEPNPEIAALRADVDRLSVRLTRPALSQTKARDTTFADRYLRKGLDAGAPEIKSLSIGVPSDGGVAVPNEIDGVIDGTLKSISPIRRIANVVQVGSANFRKLIV